MARTNKLTDAQAKEATANAHAADSSVALNAGVALKSFTESVEGLLYVGVFIYFAWRARTLLTTRQLHDWLISGSGDVTLWLSDQTGFVVGPLVSAFLPGAWTNNLKSLLNNELNGIVSSFPNNYLEDQVSDLGGARRDMLTLTGVIKGEGWWEPKWREVPGTYDPQTQHGTLTRIYLEGLRPSWLFALMFSSVCTLVAKGAAGLLKKVIP